MEMRRRLNYLLKLIILGIHMVQAVPSKAEVMKRAQWPSLEGLPEHRLADIKTFREGAVAEMLEQKPFGPVPPAQDTINLVPLQLQYTKALMEVELDAGRDISDRAVMRDVEQKASEKVAGDYKAIPIHTAIAAIQQDIDKAAGEWRG